jgi:hypothetical protein
VATRTENLKAQRRALRRHPLTEAERRAYAQLRRQRPRTRADCRDGPRPCPWVSCEHHLGLDVRPNGSIRFASDVLDPLALPETCALDVAERGGLDREEVARLALLTRQAVWLFERMVLLQLVALEEELPPAQRCSLCGGRAVGWLAACRFHAQKFGQSALGGEVVAQALPLAEAWARWVESAA